MATVTVRDANEQAIPNRQHHGVMDTKTSVRHTDTCFYAHGCSVAEAGIQPGPVPAVQLHLSTCTEPCDRGHVLLSRRACPHPPHAPAAMVRGRAIDRSTSRQRIEGLSGHSHL